MKKRGRPKLNRKNCKSCDKKLNGSSPVYCKKCYLYNGGRHTPHLRKKRLEYDKEYQRNKRADNPGMKTEEYAKWREKNPEKYKAHKLFLAAKLRGDIKKQPCQDCGRTDYIHAHHSDYFKPLEVIWLCPIHHKNYHPKPNVVMANK